MAIAVNDTAVDISSRRLRATPVGRPVQRRTKAYERKLQASTEVSRELWWNLYLHSEWLQALNLPELLCLCPLFCHPSPNAHMCFPLKQSALVNRSR